MDNILKQKLRKEYLTKLKKLDKATKRLWDKEIFKRFITSDYFKNHQTFALYWSLDYEVNTHQIIETLLKFNKKVCLPRINGKELIFYYISNINQLVIDNKFRIAQPLVTNSIANNKDIEIIVVPLVAFDQKHNRIGYGGGFYDRFLSNNIKAITVGLGYKIQLIENISYQYDSWDIPLFAVLTNK